MRWMAIVLFGWLATSGLDAAAGPKVVARHHLTLEAVDSIVAAAEKDAQRQNAKVVIAVVDAGGALIVLRRLDGTQVASVGVAIDKARTAAIYRRPSKVFEDQTSKGRVGALALSGAVPLQGGIPITYKGEVVGAIGVSGETPTIDENIAIAGAKVAENF
ncbi:MAG: heme-binding protein [Myxococcota bacterium]